MNEKGKQQMYEIGNDIAKLWDAKCVGFKINAGDKSVDFICENEKEMFITVLYIKEIEENYNLKVNELFKN